MTLLLALSALLASMPIPQLDNPVVDRAKVLGQGEKARLESLARQAHESGGPQLAFLLVPSLEGEPVEDAAIRVAEAWKLGSRSKDDGILFLVSLQERQMRIEVGGGLEGAITDVQASRIIQDTLVPAFRRGAYGEGLYAAAIRALDLAGWEGAKASAQPKEEPPPWLKFLAVALILGVMVFGSRLRGLGGPGGGFPRGGGGFPGGGFPRGGGGYRGGGGGFSGGGASGRW